MLGRRERHSRRARVGGWPVNFALKPWAAVPAFFATGVLRQSAGPFHSRVEPASREASGNSPNAGPQRPLCLGDQQPAAAPVSCRSGRRAAARAQVGCAPPHWRKRDLGEGGLRDAGLGIPKLRQIAQTQKMRICRELGTATGIRTRVSGPENSAKTVRSAHLRSYEVL
jgi:hypothetical protein